MPSPKHKKKKSGLSRWVFGFQRGNIVCKNKSLKIDYQTDLSSPFPLFYDTLWLCIYATIPRSGNKKILSKNSVADITLSMRDSIGRFESPTSHRLGRLPRLLVVFLSLHPPSVAEAEVLQPGRQDTCSVRRRSYLGSIIYLTTVFEKKCTGGGFYSTLLGRV